MECAVPMQPTVRSLGYDRRTVWRPWHPSRMDPCDRYRLRACFDSLKSPCLDETRPENALDFNSAASASFAIRHWEQVSFAAGTGARAPTKLRPRLASIFRATNGSVQARELAQPIAY